MNEATIRHLEFIQNVITRMNTNSFLIKGWMITLVSALFVFAAKDSDARYAIITYAAKPLTEVNFDFYIKHSAVRLEWPPMLVDCIAILHAEAGTTSLLRSFRGIVLFCGDALASRPAHSTLPASANSPSTPPFFVSTERDLGTAGRLGMVLR